MSISVDVLETLVLHSGDRKRLLQDSPVLPDVWLEFAKGTARVDVLLTPDRGVTAGRLARVLTERLPPDPKRSLASAQAAVTCLVTL